MAEPAGHSEGSTRQQRISASLQEERPRRPRLAESLSTADLRRSPSASLSLGNQTLLQVLNAVGDFDAHRRKRRKSEGNSQQETDGEDGSPAEEEDVVDSDGDDHGLSSADEDDMAMSIHAIHRPLQYGDPDHVPLAPTTDDPEKVSRPEIDPTAVPLQYSPVMDELEALTVQDKPPSPSTSTRSAPSRRSTKESRIQRRIKLATMLKEVFGLDEEEPVIAEFPCWLFRSVLLQGFLYLTEGHICFYAYVRNKEGQTIRSGSLAKRSSLTGRLVRHWFILRDDAFSWYPSSTEPYFPDGDVSLQYCLAVEPSKKHARQFKINTSDRRLRFQADTEASRDDWVRVLRKAVFQSQNEGESVKIAVPLETVLGIERTELDFLDVLRIRILDQDTGYSVEEYPFCYFSDLQGALAQLQQQLDAFRIKHAGHLPVPREPSTTTAVPATDATMPVRLSGHTKSESAAPKASLSSSLRAAAVSLSRSKSRSNQGGVITNDPPSAEPESTVEGMSASNATMRVSAADETALSSMASSEEGFSYPPQAAGSQPASLGQDTSWAGWIKGGGASLSRVTTRIPSLKRRKVSEVVSRPQRTMTAPGQMQGVGEQEGNSDGEEEPKSTEERFRTYFSMPEKEELLAVFPAYLFRMLPVSGKIYISAHYVCFRATNMVSKAKMVLPLRDIIVVEQSRGSRLGYHGLVLTIKGHEELFFEVSSRSRCSQIRRLINDKLEIVHRDISEGKDRVKTAEYEESEKLRRLEPSASWLDPTPSLQGSLEEAPPVMFRSDSSSFVTFRPPESLHITCLTIGSRGDVQPYIALCKGLIKEGHKCRIASHGEYQDWIEGHGIEFKAVGGDPAELMRICVENGMFTMSFLREGVTKFRGWLDDLLKTSWGACQGTDLLIESPSAMAGIHIAEALQIPYYRAFTMPWTKTRAYPHAFAVPERKLGGQYNYLSYAMFDSIFWKAISGQVNRWRKQTLGLHSTSADKMDANKTPFLYNFSTSIVPPPLDWPEWIHITGYWFLEQPDDSASKKWSPPETLVSFLDKARKEGKKVVYIGFGSIVVSDPEELTQTISDAVQKADVYAIVSKGWSDRLSSKDDSAQVKRERADQEAKERKMMSDQIYTVSAIPHDWLFDRIDAACHHGGAGTTGASLRAGIPTIIRAWFGDQYFWQARVEALGIGTGLRKMTVDTLAEALKAATTDEKQIARAKLVGQHIRSENGVATAIESIYRDLEYAKSLIKRNTRRETAEAANAPAATNKPTSKGSAPASSSMSRPNSGLWPSRDEASDEGSWDHISRGSRAGDTDDDVLSRSGIGSSPIMSPTASSRRASDGELSDVEEEEAAARTRSRSRPRAGSVGTARSPTRQSASTSRFSRLSAVLPSTLHSSKSRE